MANLTHILDYNRLYGLKLDYNAQTQELTVSVDGKSAPWPRLVQALLRTVNIAGVRGEKVQRDIPEVGTDGKVVFSGITRNFTLRLGPEPIGTYTVEIDGELSQSMTRPLTVSEVRQMGTFHRAVPYTQAQKGLTAAQNQALIEKAQTAIFTDFHTHSSGQISPRGLITVAKQHDAYYPLEALDEAGIEINYVRFPKAMRKDIKRVPFPPREKPGVTLSPMVEAVPIRALRPDELRKLEAKMAMPTDRQSTYSEAENDAYFFRYPLSKNTDLTKDSMKQMAREYALQGIKYAEISYVGLDNPYQLQMMHEAMEEIARDPATRDVQIRFRHAIPRTFPLQKIEESLEKAKILLDSPYITGIDIVGYEVNKAKKFNALLDNFCEWANENKPGCNISAHAGENDKNLGNVKEMLDLATRYENLHFRIGHGVYGMDEEAVNLARQLCNDEENPRLTIEPNPSSVIALNNVDDLTQIPFKRMVENNIPFVVGSDSSGTYSTTALQLGLEAMYGGLDDKGFDMLIRHQQHLMDKQLAYSQRQAKAIAGWDTTAGKADFITDMIARLARVPAAIVPHVTPPSIDDIRAKLNADEVLLIEPGAPVPELDSRKPVTFVGASGESWARMTPEQQRESSIAVDMLIHALDPEKAYLVQGRAKSQGLSDVLRNARERADVGFAAQGKAGFYNVGLLAEPKFDDHVSYAHLTHMERMPGKLLDLADAIVEHTFQHEGVLVAVGGAAFTRDIILKADQRGMLDDDPDNDKMMLLLECAKGASAEKAKVLSPDYKTTDGPHLVRKMLKQHPELFRSDFDRNKIDELYRTSAARVEAYGTPVPDSVIEGGAQVLSLAAHTAAPGRRPG